MDEPDGASGSKRYAVAPAPGTNPTLLYGGGRNAPLTLTKATVVKELVTPDAGAAAVSSSLAEPASAAATDFLKLPNATSKKASSIYASCHSQDDLNSSVEEFRSAHTSLEEDESRNDSKFLLLILIWMACGI